MNDKYCLKRTVFSYELLNDSYVVENILEGLKTCLASPSTSRALGP